MTIRNTLTRAVGGTKLKVQKNSPHILFVAGLAGVVTSTVLACRATLRIEPQLDDMKTDFERARDTQDRREIAHAYVYNGGKFIREYAPALVIGVVSVGLLTSSHVQLSRRNAALTAAYTGLHQAYMEYRARVREEVGENKELELFHGISLEEAKNEAGKLATRKVVDPNKLSPYAVLFDEANPNWQKNAEFNRLFIQCQQTYANQRLQAVGHVFLNEVYDALGIQHSSAGAVVGWVLNGEGDNYVDFGMFEAYNADFINRHEPSLILDFNVDGVIFDKI